MPVKIFGRHRARASTGAAPKLTGAGQAGRIPERPGALEEYFKREAAFTAAAAAVRDEARRKLGEQAPKKEAPMRIRMLITRKGSEDGIHARAYEAGQSYEMAPSLATPWLARGYCELDRMVDKAPQPGPSRAPEQASTPKPAEGKPQTPPEAAAPAAKGRDRARGSKRPPAGPASV